jgi:rhodanese-related sulfurtransferase
LKEVHQAMEEKKRIVIVDARAPSDWLNLHIPGSISLPYYDLGPIDRLPDDGTWIIAYCACPHHASGAVVDALRARGIKTSAVLDEGVFAWQRAGYPVVTAPNAAPPPAPPPLASSGPR